MSLYMLYHLLGFEFWKMWYTLIFFVMTCFYMSHTNALSFWKQPDLVGEIVLLQTKMILNMRLMDVLWVRLDVISPLTRVTPLEQFFISLLGICMILVGNIHLYVFNFYFFIEYIRATRNSRLVFLLVKIALVKQSISKDNAITQWNTNFHQVTFFLHGNIT